MLAPFKKSKVSLIASLVCGAAASSASGETALSARPIDYNRDVRSILADNCFTCHGPDSAARKASLRLDSFDAATAPRKDGKPAVVPGKPDESEAIRRLFTTDEEDIMPPTKSKKTLKPEQKEILKRWVASGAKYQEHWAYIPPRRSDVPATKDKAWITNPVDAFILARLEKEGLQPAPEADRATLARRVSLDLTGLPPSPEFVKAFAEDKSPGAYERMVDRLLNSNRYGEHRARYWLDAARYADTHGIHIDNYREIWSYREWVINAFNANMPFDRFTVEQLGGDLLPNPSLEQRIATGFNRCNMTTSEGGAIDEEYRVIYTRDRTETTAQVWLGVTAGCCVCHDHKFDPFTQREFYQMSAFFNNTTQPAMDGNKKDTPPIVVVPKSQDRPRWDQLPQEKKLAKDRVDKRRETAVEDYKKWLAESKPGSMLQELPLQGLQFLAPLNDGASQTLSLFVNGYPRSANLAEKAATQPGVVAETAFTTGKQNVPTVADAGDFERDRPFSAGLWVRLDPSDKEGSIIARMDEDDRYRGWDIWIQGGKPAMHLVHKWPEDAIKVVSKREIEANKWAHVFITYDGSSKAEGITIYINGEIVDVERPTNKLQNSLLSKAPFKIGQRKNGDLVEKAGVQDVRLYSRVLKQEEIRTLKNSPRLAYLVAKPADKRTEEEGKALYDSYLSGFDGEFQKATLAMGALEKEERDIKTRGTIAHVMQEKPEAPSAYVLFRGEYDKRRDQVFPAVPKVLPAWTPELPMNRLGFAKWLLLPEQPLTARVAANRMWQEVFGTGIVRTSNDFGLMGEAPSHQELLDWLALEFRDSGWDMKAMYKLLVMSSTYRQSAVATPDKVAKDPQNRLLARGPRFRMDAEMVRDYALAASGLLSPKIGGPSARPYQPEGVWEMVAMQESDTRNYKKDAGENLYRRSMYTFWKRTAPPASMDIMNAPTRENCTLRRERTNTPLQALATLNDPQFIEAARRLAESALLDCPGTDAERLDLIALRLLSRPLRSEERKVVESVLGDLRSHYAKSKDEAAALVAVGESVPDPKLEKPTLAAYTMVVNQLMNLDEVLNK